MSEFWKSNAKKYCDYCKVWIADNKAVIFITSRISLCLSLVLMFSLKSISIHEQGNTHKKNVKQKLDEVYRFLYISLVLEYSENIFFFTDQKVSSSKKSRRKNLQRNNGFYRESI
jgi:hypothetical protein